MTLYAVYTCVQYFALILRNLKGFLVFQKTAQNFAHTCNTQNSIKIFSKFQPTLLKYNFI